MIISMKLDATKEQIEHVCERIREFGYKVHSIQGEQRVVIGAVGTGDVTACLESLEGAPGVESAVRISSPYKFVSREFKREGTQIRRRPSPSFPGRPAAAARSAASRVLCAAYSGFPVAISLL